MKRRIETLSLMIDEFVSVKSTFEQKRFTDQMQKMSSSLYLQPITVIKVSKIPNYNKLTLYDVSTGKIVTDNKKKQNAWLVIDGSKRLKAMMQCYNSTADNSYLTVDAVIEHIDNIPNQDIIQYLIDIDYMINEPSKKDFVDLAYKKCPDNPIIQMIYLMMSMGASLATVSRYSTGDSDRLNVRSIVEYLHGNQLAVSTVSYKRALELYRLFIEKGFSLKTINQRYLIDYINKQMNAPGMNFQEVVNRIASANNVVVDEIEKMTSMQKELGGIDDKLERHYQRCLKHGTNATYNVDYSDERFTQNLMDIPRLLNQ